MRAIGSRLSRSRPPLLAVALCTILACSDDEVPTQPSAAATPELSRSANAAYTFVDLGNLGACCTGRATAINDRDQVVGVSDVPFADDGGPGRDRGTHPFLWQNGVMTDLGFDFSGASGISNDGTVVISSARFDFGSAFLWKDGVVTQLNGLGGELDGASAISPNGQVTGISVPDFQFTTIDAVVWDKSGAITNLGILAGSARSSGRDINARGDVVGEFDSRAALWSGGHFTSLGTLGGQFSFANGINAKGTIVGCSEFTGGGFGRYHAFIWTDGAMGELGSPDGLQSCANDIDNAGRVVGWAELASGVFHAVMWDHGVVTDLGLLAGPGSSEAIAINAKGTVVGTFRPSSLEQDEHAAMWIRKQGR
jgi:probable HAF family extracellular repeat protein